MLWRADCEPRAWAPRNAIENEFAPSGRAGWHRPYGSNPFSIAFLNSEKDKTWYKTKSGALLLICLVLYYWLVGKYSEVLVLAFPPFGGWVL
jgi:hypothetical protein